MVDKLIGHASVPAPELFNGIAEVEWHNARGHPSWLLGEYRDHGWWYFFLVVFAVKTPLAFILLCIAGYDACFSRTSREHFDWQLWAPGACAPAILAVCIPTSINLGVRHILIMYPMLAIVAGYGATSLIQTRKKAVMALAIALLLWQTLSSALAHPDYLAYFNELVWSEPERVLSDSDLDWGQDMQRLSNKLKELGVKEVSLVCFSNADISQLGFPTVRLPEPYQPVTGWIAVSAHMATIESAMTEKDLKDPTRLWAGWNRSGRWRDRQIHQAVLRAGAALMPRFSISFAAILLVAAGIARIVATYPVFNETSDEAHHVACGMQWLAERNTQYGGEHPPLAQIAAAMGPYIAGSALPASQLWRRRASRFLTQGDITFGI